MRMQKVLKIGIKSVVRNRKRYGHIKSQLIEAGFAQKDEFGLLMNAVESMVSAVKSSNSWSAFKSAVDVDAINTFAEFCEFRTMCSEAAHVVMNAYPN